MGTVIDLSAHEVAEIHAAHIAVERALRRRATLMREAVRAHGLEGQEVEVDLLQGVIRVREHVPATDLANLANSGQILGLPGQSWPDSPGDGQP